MNWFRWYHGTVTDPKLAYIAHVSKQPLSLVIAVWAALLETASQSNPRGSIASFDPESYSVTLVTVTSQIEIIIQKMEQKELLQNGFIGKWGARQCDPTAAERQRKCRENKKSHVTHVTDVTVTPVTSRNVTPEEKRIYKPILYNLEFETFWQMYPNKTGKGAAWKSWQKEVDDVAKVMSALEWQIESQNWIKEGGKYIPMPSTYLNQRRWEDEPQTTQHSVMAGVK